jgi:hypothetical protein
MTNFTINESVNIYEYITKPEVKEGDTIEVASNNQQNYKKFLVIMDINNKKNVKTLANHSIEMYEDI